MRRSVSMPLPSSMLTTPSRPTWSIALASTEPISVSPLAEIVPILAIILLDLAGLACPEIFFRAIGRANSISRLRPIGSRPPATARIPPCMIALAMTIAVVVPSPTSSETFEPTCRIMRPPMSSIGSNRLTWRAIV